VEEGGELGEALVLYQMRKGQFSADFLVFILEELHARRNLVCGFCGWSLKRHTILMCNELSDGHRFREMSWN